MNVKTIPLAKLNELFYIVDGFLYWKNPPPKKGQLKDTPITCKSRIGYVVVTIDRSQYFVHRIMYQMYNNLPELDTATVIDHVDGDRANNRLENLRIATHAQNMYNRKKHINNKSGYKFISRNNMVVGNIEYSYWLLSISQKELKTTKRFPYTDDGLRDAILYRDNIVSQLHGEFANLG